MQRENHRLTVPALEPHDWAGIALLLFLHENGLPGRYALFVGEEVGGVGSSAATSEWRRLGLEVVRVVSFDRKGGRESINQNGSHRVAPHLGLDGVGCKALYTPSTGTTARVHRLAATRRPSSS